MGRVKVPFTRYYEIRKLIDAYPEARYYVVYGERSAGKTYSSVAYALERYFRTEEQFAYVRRLYEDVKPKNITQLFEGHVKNKVIQKLSGGEYTGATAKMGGFYFTKRAENRKLELSPEPFGYFFDLNGWLHYKSYSWPKITTVIFDEFMTRSGYLPNEFEIFKNMLSTIVRERDNVKIIMLANTVNRYCPYFSEMGLVHAKTQKQGTVDVYNYGDSGLQVVCEYTQSSQLFGGKPSDVYFAFDDPDLSMVVSGAWEMNIYPRLEGGYTPRDVLKTVYIVFDGETVQCDIVAQQDDLYLHFKPKTTEIRDSNAFIYGTQPQVSFRHKAAITKQSDRTSRLILRLVHENKAFYATNVTGETVRNYLIWSNQQDIRR